MELLSLVLKLRKAELYKVFAETDAMFILSRLLGEYPWNNFLHLQLFKIYEELFDNQDLGEFRGILLQKSNIA